MYSHIYLTLMIIFSFCLHLSRVPFHCFILFILSKTLANTFVCPSNWNNMLRTRPFVRVARSARPAQVLVICAVLSVVASASTQGRSPAVSLVGVCVTPRVCCCCPNWRICRQKERKCTSPPSGCRITC